MSSMNWKTDIIKAKNMTEENKHALDVLTDTYVYVLEKYKHVPDALTDVYMHICVNENVDLLKLTLPYITDIHINQEKGFRNICYYRDKNYLAYFLEYANSINSPVNINIKDEAGFVRICNNGNLDTLKYLLDYADSIGSPVNIHANQEKGFRSICLNNEPKMLKYLIQYSEQIDSPIDMHVMDQIAFKKACTESQYYLNETRDLEERFCDAEDLLLRNNTPQIAEYLAELSMYTNIKYLFDKNACVGYIFGSETHTHEYLGTEFVATHGEINSKFLDENMHKLVKKKSAR